MQKDYYQTLGISPRAGSEEIKKAYRHLAFKYHPDSNGGKTESEEKFKEVSEAYGVLIDPQKRGDYDHRRAKGKITPENAAGFSFAQPEIFRDLMQNSSAWNLFREMGREAVGSRFEVRFMGKIIGGGGQSSFETFSKVPPASSSSKSFPGKASSEPNFWSKLARRVGEKVNTWLEGELKK
jgi:DnaJ-class molecular chaperone